MWTKIYLIALTLAVLPLIFLNYYSFSWLQSIGAPVDAVGEFNYYSNFAWNYLWIAALLLLIIGNVIIWKTHKAWALWTTFAYFGIFVIVKYFWLDLQLADFKQTKGITDGGISAGVFTGVFYFIFFAVIVFFNQFIMLRLSERMHPQTELQNIPSDSPADISEIKEIEVE